jgi:hypothetical protein
MDAVREQINKPIVVGIAALILGILLGVFYGWVINPVQWTDAAVEHLRIDLKEDYLRMAIDSYAVNKDAQLAQQRYTQLGDSAEQLLVTIQTNPGSASPASIEEFTAAVAVQLPETPSAVEEEPAEGSSFASIALPILCVVTLLVAAGLGYYFFIRSRGSGDDYPEMETYPEEAQPTDSWSKTTIAEVGDEPPMVQFMASYKLGDDLFDDSFSIDSPAGEFLGECGVGISESIGVGDPKKVTAFEVWLFDKNDIQTVTKVLMSAHAFLDEAIRQRLAAKGEPVLAEAESESILETQTLRLTARVVDIEYGNGALPEHSFFDYLVLELAVHPKF